MLSNVGHDLRTPLAALRVAVEALTDGVAPDPDRYLRSMRRDVEALSALVDDFFLLARIESGRLDLRPGRGRSHRARRRGRRGAGSGRRRERRDARARGAAQASRARATRRRSVASIRNLIDNAIRHAPRRLRGPCRASSGDAQAVGVRRR